MLKENARCAGKTKKYIVAIRVRGLLLLFRLPALLATAARFVPIFAGRIKHRLWCTHPVARKYYFSSSRFTNQTGFIPYSIKTLFAILGPLNGTVPIDIFDNKTGNLRSSRGTS